MMSTAVQTGSGNEQKRGATRGLSDAIGATPLLPLRFSGLDPRVELWVKAEWLNPGGSVKDRAARSIVEEGLAAGELPGKRLLDASSGNTAIAYSMLGAARGFGVTIFLPANASRERKMLLHAYGAEVFETDPLEGSDGAIRLAHELALREPHRYYYADQYNNPANARAHYVGTGPEIWRQTKGRVTHLVAGLGTTGTLMGVARFLKEQNAELVSMAVEPDAGFHGIEGLKHLPSAIVPGLYDANLVDRTERVETEAAYTMARQLARRHGYFVGPSSGAAAVAARRLAEELEDGLAVVIFPSSGERYLSLELW